MPKKAGPPRLSMPLVTVGVPVYNGEEYLERALSSILAQSYSHLEILISDNCSTDGTAAICRRVAATDPRISYVLQDRNIGAFENFQFLLDRARGEYFMWQAADDDAEPELVEKLVAALEANPDYSVAGTDVRVIDEAGRTLRVERLASVRFERVQRDWPRVLRGFFRYYIDNRYLLIYGMFRTRTAQRCSMTCYGRFRGVVSVEIPFLAQIACAGRALSIDKPLKIYRVHGGSAYQEETRQAARPGKIVSRYLNIWGCLWMALGRSRVSWPTYLWLASYLLASFPLYLARCARKEIVAMFGRGRRPAG